MSCGGVAWAGAGLGGSARPEWAPADRGLGGANANPAWIPPQTLRRQDEAMRSQAEETRLQRQFLTDPPQAYLSPDPSAPMPQRTTSFSGPRPEPQSPTDFVREQSARLTPFRPESLLPNAARPSSGRAASLYRVQFPPRRRRAPHPPSASRGSRMSRTPPRRLEPDPSPRRQRCVERFRPMGPRCIPTGSTTAWTSWSCRTRACPSRPTWSGTATARPTTRSASRASRTSSST